MNRVTTVSASLAFLFFAHQASVSAEDSLLGTYRGYFTIVTMHGQVQVGADLVIDYADNGKVRGTMTQYNRRPEAGGVCNGRYALRGKYEGSSLELGTMHGG